MDIAECDMTKATGSSCMNGLALLNFSLQERDIAANSLVQGDEIYLGVSYVADLKT